MDDTTEITVPGFGHKLKALFDLAKSRRERGYPRTRISLAAAMTKAGYKTDGSKITKVDAGDRHFSVCEHKALLAQFGVAWPCRHYYDGDAGGDGSVEAFRKFIFRETYPISLIAAAGVNWDPFPNRGLFVFELKDEKPGAPDYQGRVIAKPIKMPLMGEDEEWLGREIGYCSFSEFTIYVTTHGAMDATVDRPQEFDDKQGEAYEVIDRSFNGEPAWFVRALPPTDSKRALDGNIDVARLVVFQMEPTDSVHIVAKGPLPGFTPHIPPEVEKNAAAAKKLAVTFGRIAQNKVIDPYTRSPQPSESGGQKVTLGDLTFRLKKN